MPQPMVPVTNEATAPGEALESFRSEIDAMRDNDVVVARVDVAASALTAIGSMPEIDAHRAQILSVFGASAGDTLDRLVPIARAVLAAHAAYIMERDRDLEPMAAELMEVRSRLFIAASALIQRKHLHKKALDGLNGGQSYQGRVVDTMALAGLFRVLLPTLREHTKVDEDQIAQAERLADQFGAAYSLRDQAQAGSSKGARDRARAFTIFFRAYERIRQMLTYLRWHDGDVEEIAPSLFTRGPRKQDAEDDVGTPTPGTDNPPNRNPVPPGMPGADPFTTT